MSRRRAIVDLVRARAEVVSVSPLVGTQTVGVINSFGTVLAEDVLCATDVPVRHVALCDGYAVISADTHGARRDHPVSLGVVGELPPESRRKLESGTAVLVRRGGPLPLDADAVVQTTDTYRPDQGPLLMVFADVKPLHNVRAAGSVLTAGSLLASSGTVIGPHEMGLFADMGIHGVKVSRRPRVLLVTVSSGVVDILDPIKPGQIRNSARYNLAGMISDAGCEVSDLRHITSGRIGIENALSDCGASGAVIVALGPDEKHDAAMSALNGVGELLFDRVQMEPGSATAFGLVEGRPVFIVGFDTALESFEAVVRPALMNMQRASHIDRSRVRAELNVTITPSNSSHNIIRALTWFDGDRYATRALGKASVCDQLTTKPNSLILIPPQSELAKRGEMVDVWLL